MKYQLAPFLLADVPVVEYSKAQFDDFCRARDVILAALSHEYLIHNVLRNYEEFEKELLDIALSHSIALSPDVKWTGWITAMQLLGRRLANLLSSARSYLDQTPQALHAVCGDASSEWTEVKKILSSAYDNMLGYRVCEALRNHVQHSGLGVHSIIQSHELVKPSSGPAVYASSVIPRISVNSLRADDSFKPAILEALEIGGVMSNGERMHDLRPFVREYLTGLATAHQHTRKKLTPHVDAAAKVINETISAYSRAFPNADPSALALADLTDDGLIEDRIPLFVGTQQIDQWKMLNERNPLMFNFLSPRISN